MKRLSVLLLVLLWSRTGAAQQIGVPQTVSVQDSSTACSVAYTCASFVQGVTQSPSLTLSVAGTFSGTLTFEVTGDGANWFSVLATNSATAAQATTTTATGLYSFPNAGFLGARARATSWSSGAALVAGARGSGSARIVPPTFLGNFAATTLCVDATNKDACLFRGSAGLLQVVTSAAGMNYGTLDLLGLKASGTAGASCALAIPAHLTVVNGIVTVCN